VFVAVVTPPPQLYVTPTVVDDAVMVTLVTLQVSVAGGAILRSGGVTLWVIATEEEALQPFDGSVIVTV
jgi:hypothetical protein